MPRFLKYSLEHYAGASKYDETGKLTLTHTLLRKRNNAITKTRWFTTLYYLPETGITEQNLRAC